MIKPKIAYAIVSKKRPSIDVMELYTKEQIKNIRMSDKEMIVKVVISLKK